MINEQRVKSHAHFILFLGQQIFHHILLARNNVQYVKSLFSAMNI